MGSGRQPVAGEGPRNGHSPEPLGPDEGRNGEGAEA